MQPDSLIQPLTDALPGECFMGSDTNHVEHYFQQRKEDVLHLYPGKLLNVLPVDFLSVSPFPLEPVSTLEFETNVREFIYLTDIYSLWKV